MEIDACKSELRKLNSVRDSLEDELYDWEEKSKCESCKSYNREVIGKYEERYINCSGCKKSKNLIEISSNLQRIEDEIDDFIENKYAKVVFEKYKDKPIILYEKYDKKQLSWEEAFGLDFDKVSKTLRHAIVGIVEGEGRYEIV